MRFRPISCEIQPIYTGSDDTVIRHTVDLTIPGELYLDGAEAGTLALTAMKPDRRGTGLD